MSDGTSTLVDRTLVQFRRHLSGRYISSESECDYTSTSCACATGSFPYVEGAPEEATISMAQHIKNGIDAEDHAVDRRARNHRDLGCVLRIKALRLYTSVITSSTTNVVTASSLISQEIEFAGQPTDEPYFSGPEMPAIWKTALITPPIPSPAMRPAATAYPRITVSHIAS
jgi:hypothetical protein